MYVLTVCNLMLSYRGDIIRCLYDNAGLGASDVSTLPSVTSLALDKQYNMFFSSHTMEVYPPSSHFYLFAVIYLPALR